jgi:hypothetical protein
MCLNSFVELGVCVCVCLNVCMRVCLWVSVLGYVCYKNCAEENNLLKNRKVDKKELNEKKIK